MRLRSLVLSLYNALFARAVEKLFFHQLVTKTNNFGKSNWLGKPIWQNTFDLWIAQETIYEVKPSLIIECGTNRGGSAYFYAQLFDLMDTDGKVLEGATSGNLCLEDSWPGQMRTVYGDHQRFIDTYFVQYPGTYFTGDGCRRDEDGYYWITGRVDDVLNVSGHRLGTAEIESALVAHPDVAEAAVVGYPHDIKGQGIYCYITLNAGLTGDDDLKKTLVQWVRKEIGPVAAPDLLQFAPGLPKTRSGKIMRRILRKIAEDDFSNLGDTSTLADPEVVEDLIDNRQNKLA